MPPWPGLRQTAKAPGCSGCGRPRPHVVGDVAGGCRELASLLEELPPVAFADVVELLPDLAWGAALCAANEVADCCVWLYIDGQVPVFQELDDAQGLSALSGALLEDTRRSHTARLWRQTAAASSAARKSACPEPHSAAISVPTGPITQPIWDISV